MDIAELKIKVIEKVTSIEDEELLKSILKELSEDRPQQKVYNLSGHFESISARYDETLKKLAE